MKVLISVVGGRSNLDHMQGLFLSSMINYEQRQRLLGAFECAGESFIYPQGLGSEVIPAAESTAVVAAIFACDGQT